MLKNRNFSVKVLSVFISVFFLNYALIAPLHAQSIYKDTRSVLEGTIYQGDTPESSFEAKLKEIRGRQDFGRAVFFAGTGLTVAYFYTVFFVKSEEGSLSFLFGVPLLATALIWYGFGEAINANREEAVLMYQQQLEEKENMR